MQQLWCAMNTKKVRTLRLPWRAIYLAQKQPVMQPLVFNVSAYLCRCFEKKFLSAPGFDLHTVHLLLRKQGEIHLKRDM